MPNKLMPLLDKCLLRKRSILETIVDQLKNISQIEQTRHRSLWNLRGRLIAYIDLTLIMLLYKLICFRADQLVTSIGGNA
jgi:hypothetical protein